jgi:hypothetical protein
MTSLNPETLHKLRLLAADTEIPVRISGSCMSPLIEDQATLMVHSRSWYWPGDILTFLDRDGRMTTHRLLGIYPRNGKLYCLTRPDRHPHPDVPVPVSRVLGRVVGGECRTEAIHIPWYIRLLALKRFTIQVLRHLFRP